MKNGLKLGLATVVAATALNANEPKVNDFKEAKALITTQVKGDVLGLGINNGLIYIEKTLNFDDEKGVGVAYFNSGITVGASYVTKNNVGIQKGIGAGYVTNWGDNAYLGGVTKYTEFNSNNGYANSKSAKSKVFTGFEFNNNLVGEVGAEYKITTFNGYGKKDINGALIYTPDSRNYSIEVRGAIDDIQNKIMTTVSFPIRGKISKSSLSVGQHTVEKYVADSIWDK